MRALNIIGLSFSFIVLIMCFAVLAEPRSMPFDEFGGFFILSLIINLAFFIVLLVLKRKTSRPSNPEIVDEII
jgi:hypothetical protein